jgi:hypothetical protein
LSANVTTKELVRRRRNVATTMFVNIERVSPREVKSRAVKPGPRTSTAGTSSVPKNACEGARSAFARVRTSTASLSDRIDPPVDLVHHVVVGRQHFGRVDHTLERAHDRVAEPPHEIVPVDEHVAGRPTGRADDQRSDPLRSDPVGADAIASPHRDTHLEAVPGRGGARRLDGGPGGDNELLGRRRAVRDVALPFDVGVVRIDQGQAERTGPRELAFDPVGDAERDVVGRLRRLRDHDERDVSDQLGTGERARVRSHERTGPGR